MSRYVWFTLIAVAVVAGSTLAVAQKRSNDRSDSARRVNATSSTDGVERKRRRAEQPMALTPSRKAAALEFAKQHHPELAHLLRGLEKRNRNAYYRAMRQLYQTSERLARTKERLSAERFELELEAWKLDSRIRLLAARVAVSKKVDPRIKAELDHALRERVDIRVRRMQKERERLLQRANKLSETIAGIEADRDKATEQYLNRVNRGLGIKNRKARSKQRPANRKNAKRKRSEATGKSKPADRSKPRDQKN